MMVGSECSTTVSTLLCKEDGGFLDGDGGGWSDVSGLMGSEMGIFGDGGGDDLVGYMEVLVAKEGSFFEKAEDCDGGSLVEAADRLRFSRTEAVRWILKTRAFFGFSFRTAYLAVTYLDRFFVKRTLESQHYWAIRLVSIACLSLAAKMEECYIPTLPDFQYDECSFDSNSVQRMELLVLSTLGWRMRSVTPFPYLCYLASNIDSELQPKELVSKATEAIFMAIEKMNLVDHRPSSVAVAAFFAASGQQLTKAFLESVMVIKLLCGSSKIEHVLSCYNLIEEMQMKKPKLNSNLISKVVSSSTIPADTVDSVIDSSLDNPADTVASTISCNKRRKLV